MVDGHRLGDSMSEPREAVEITSRACAELLVANFGLSVVDQGVGEWPGVGLVAM